jgi:hypothetical protein
VHSTYLVPGSPHDLHRAVRVAVSILTRTWQYVAVEIRNLHSTEERERMSEMKEVICKADVPGTRETGFALLSRILTH